MPDLVVCADGEDYLLNSAVSTPWTLAELWEIHLYKNDLIPNRDTVLADLVESDASGYAPITLNRDLWSPSAQLGGRGVTMYTGVTPAWNTSSGSQLIYGYYVTVPSLGIMIYSQRLDAPVLMSTLTPVVIPPLFSLHSESEPPP